MPIISSHVEIVVIYPPGSISGNILGPRLLDGYWRVSNGETTDLGDPKVEKQLIWELFSSMERYKTVPRLVMASCFSWMFFLAMDGFRH